MPKIPPPITEIEFKEMLRDCFNQDGRGEIAEWSAYRGWKDRSSGSRALNWKDEQDNGLYEGYKDIYAARQVSLGLAARLWDKFSRAVFPLLRDAQPESPTSDLAEVKLLFNNWESLERNREEGHAFAEECEAARKRALEALAKYRRNGDGKAAVYSQSSHVRNLG